MAGFSSSEPCDLARQSLRCQGSCLRNPSGLANGTFTFLSIDDENAVLYNRIEPLKALSN